MSEARSGAPVPVGTSPRIITAYSAVFLSDGTERITINFDCEGQKEQLQIEQISMESEGGAVKRKRRILRFGTTG